MRLIECSQVLLLCAVGLYPGSSPAQTKADFSVQPTACTDPKKCDSMAGITILVSRGDPPVSFVSSSDTLISQVKIYRIVSADTPAVHADMIDCAILSAESGGEVATFWFTPKDKCPKAQGDAFPLAEGSYFLAIDHTGLSYAGKEAWRPHSEHPLAEIVERFNDRLAAQLCRCSILS